MALVRKKQIIETKKDEYYIIFDKNSIIYAIGTSEQEVMDNFNRNRNQTIPIQKLLFSFNSTKFSMNRCTKRLYDYINKNGVTSSLSWDINENGLADLE